MMNTVILPFGCPRAGTSYLDKAVRNLKAVDVMAFREYHSFHPCKSDEGMIGLARLFRRHDLIFVRIKRHPMEIAESFVATRLDSVRIGGFLPFNSNERVVKWIKDGIENFHLQMKVAEVNDKKRPFPWKVVQVRYEDLGTPKGRDDFVEALDVAIRAGYCSIDSLRRFLDNTFGKKKHAVIAGRLRSGLGCVLSEEERVFFKSELQGVIEQDGYE